MLSISPWYVEQFRRMLLAEGFWNVGVFQIWKKGQVFGYARQLSANLEWHVRAFVDGTLESEVELPRASIFHLLRHPYLHDGILAQFLNTHQIPYSQSTAQSSRTQSHSP